MNTCPAKEKCITFKEMYGTAENFCSKIWDESFYVPNGKNADQCMSFSFDETKPNPNKKAHDFYVKNQN